MTPDSFSLSVPKAKISSMFSSIGFRQATQGEASQSSEKQPDNFETVSRPSTNSAPRNDETKSEHGAGHMSSVGDSPPVTQPRTVNVVLFGETGVGKSSVINLIAQREVAKVSSDVNGCTMQSTRYEIPFDDMNFAIFDTIGLEEPQMGVNGYLKAIEKAYELIAELSAAGGVHLLLFCMRGGRITATTQSNYRLFCECLCSAKVPIALVFTGLEREVKMEDWWTRNRKYIEHYGIKSDGHACVTAVKDDTTEEDEKYLESQKRIRELLKGCALQNEAFSLEPFSWLVKVGRGMKSLIEKARNPKKKDIAKRLRDRCKLDPETAKKIADMIEKGDAPPNPPGDVPPNPSGAVPRDETDVVLQSQANGVPQKQLEVEAVSPSQAGIVSQNQASAVSHSQANTVSHSQANIISQSQANTISRSQVNIVSQSQTSIVSQNQADTVSQNQADAVSLRQANVLRRSRRSKQTSPLRTLKLGRTNGMEVANSDYNS